MLEILSDKVSALHISSVSPKMNRCSSYAASLLIRYLTAACTAGWLANCGREPPSLISDLVLLCAFNYASCWQNDYCMCWFFFFFQIIVFSFFLSPGP